jgi:Ca2+/H+ antiporter, TMEM165/GDT1 family
MPMKVPGPVAGGSPCGADEQSQRVDALGGAQHSIALAAAGAIAAAVVVLIAGLAVHRPLSRVPENTLKYGVGVMLTTFGIFWAGEGAGLHLPGNDASLVGLLAYVLGTSALLVSMLRSRRLRTPGHAT